MSLVDGLVKEASVSRTARHLALDRLVINPGLARRLSPTVAFRYHTVPLAEDNGCITVAMADPDDAVARAAVADALGKRLYVVQADPAAIDGLLVEIWPEETQNPLRLLVYHQASPIADQVQAYAQYLSDLLASYLSDFQTVAHADATFNNLTEAADGYDLVVFGEPDQPLIERLLSGAADLKAAEQIPSSVLVARRPRWPLKRMLLITRGYETDDVAVDWTIRLAQPSNASVTVLAVLPDVPAMCNQAVRMQCGLADWLATDTPLGQQLRRIVERLASWETEGTLRFRQGSPDRQIQCEVAGGDYDLTLIAADHSSWWSRRLLGELVTPLLGWVDRPVLVAKPTTARGRKR
jgi:nucleotide-binding universal stress UspA family protein